MTFRSRGRPQGQLDDPVLGNPGFQQVLEYPAGGPVIRTRWSGPTDDQDQVGQGQHDPGRLTRCGRSHRLVGRTEVDVRVHIDHGGQVVVPEVSEGGGQRRSADGRPVPPPPYPR